MEAYRARILVIDDERGICEAIQKALEKSGYYVEIVHESLKAIEIFRQKTFHIVICDIKMPGIDGLKLLDMMKEEDPDISVIMITGYASIESAIESIKKGAQEYIRKPFRPDQIRLVVDKVLEQKKLVEENTYLKGELKNILGKDLIIGQSKVMRDVFNLARKVAENNSPILITGESGTGKEVVARFIHYNSPRVSMPFVTVNCAAIPEHLLESELFGHKKGAFTGAIYTKKGSFELAHEGTIFLDEVGEMRLDMQAKILRILENYEIKKVGAEETLHIDVRIIAATNKDLEKEVTSGNFRKDLYYRLHVIPIHIQPLRKYKEDIPLLARYFLNLLKAERATYKTEEGVVAQIWARCIGCRACMCACPYTRRFFNWVKADWPEEMRSAINPDVSIRPLGVVEKCTFCNHRRQKAREKVRPKKWRLKEGDYVPACVQTCPAKARYFGDLDDPESIVSKLARSRRAFRLLEELRTHPKVIYLAEGEWREEI